MPVVEVKLSVGKKKFLNGRSHHFFEKYLGVSCEFGQKVEKKRSLIFSFVFFHVKSCSYASTSTSAFGFDPWYRYVENIDVDTLFGTFCYNWIGDHCQFCSSLDEFQIRVKIIRNLTNSNKFDIRIWQLKFEISKLERIRPNLVLFYLNGLFAN